MPRPLLSRQLAIHLLLSLPAWHALSAATQKTNINPAACNPTTTDCPTVADDRLWHLDRLDQNLADPTNEYRYCTDGTGVRVYVVDTGVNKFHQEFAPGTRVEAGFNASGDNMPADDPCMGFALPPVGPQDVDEKTLFFHEVNDAGHGTAVASALGGTRVGVAKMVTIVPVKVARCDGYSARFRISNHNYQANETMFRVPATGGNPEAYYRALNAGKPLHPIPAPIPIRGR